MQTDGQTDITNPSSVNAILRKRLNLGTTLAGKLTIWRREKQARDKRQADRQTDRYAVVTTWCLFAVLQASQEP